MKVVYLMRFWPVYGGGETVTRILVNELASRSNDVTIIYGIEIIKQLHI